MVTGDRADRLSIRQARSGFGHARINPLLAEGGRGRLTVRTTTLARAPGLPIHLRIWETSLDLLQDASTQGVVTLCGRENSQRA